MRALSIALQLYVLLLPISIQALPLSGPLYKRDCPTLDELTKWITDYGEIGDTSVFYSASPDLAAVGAFADSIGAKWFHNTWNQEQYDSWLTACGKSQAKLDARLSKALAKSATDQVYLLLGENPILADSVWINEEYPEIEAHGLLPVTAVRASDTTQQTTYEPHKNPWWDNKTDS